MTTQPKRRSSKKRPSRVPEILVCCAIVVVLAAAGAIIFKDKLKPHWAKLQLGGEQRKTASTGPATSAAAHLSYERVSDVGDKVRYMLDCPGTTLCVVEIQQNDEAIAKSEVDWETVQAFFIQYSTSPLIVKPVTHNGRNTHQLIRFKFKYEDVTSEGIITDQSEYRGVIPFWDAMMLSFI